MSETQVYGVVLPVALAQRARVVAALEGKSRSKLMRELLVNYLAKVDIEKHEYLRNKHEHKENKGEMK